MDALDQMLDPIRFFSLAFLPLFVAMEPIGVLPIYLSITRQMTKHEKRKVLSHSILTATLITLAFLIVGKAIFIVLGITISDFQIAGGLVLLCIAISEVLPASRGLPETPTVSEGVGIVPIGTPLIAGPAALTTILMLSDLYGFSITAAALAANLLIIWAVFLYSDKIVGLIGEKGAMGISKVIALLLAAIAVMMIRRGVMQFIG